MADSTRQRKVADRIQTTVAYTLDRRIKDPRLGFITITDCRVTGDLQNATVYYTVLGDEKQRKLTAQALRSAKGVLRSEVGKALGIRLTPELRFEHDTLQESAAEFDSALERALARDKEIAEQARKAQYAGDPDPYIEDDSGVLEGDSLAGEHDSAEFILEPDAEDSDTVDNVIVSDEIRADEDSFDTDSTQA